MNIELYSQQDTYELPSWVFIVIMVIVVLTFIAFGFIITHVNKRHESKNVTQNEMFSMKVQENQLREVRGKIASFTVEVWSLLEDFENKKIDKTMGQIKKEILEDLNEIMNSTSFKEYKLANGEDDDLVKILNEMKVTSPTIWSKNFKARIEEILK